MVYVYTNSGILKFINKKIYLQFIQVLLIWIKPNYLNAYSKHSSEIDINKTSLKGRAHAIFVM